MSSTRILLVAVAVLGLASSLGAQRVPTSGLPVGGRVRVRIADDPPGRVIGTLTAADFIALVVADDRAGSYRVPLYQVRTIEVSRKHLTGGQAFARGALIGALVSGSISVVALGLAVYQDLHDKNDVFIPATVIVGVGSAIFTMTGTVLGGVIGLGSRDQWRQVWP